MLARNVFKKLLNAKIILAIFCFLNLLLFGFAGNQMVSATVLNNVGDNLKTAFGGSPSNSNELAISPSLPVLIGSLLQIVLSILGLGLLGLIVYGGYYWLTAGGKAEEVEKAVKILKSAIWGFIVILAAFTITTFVVTSLTSKIIGN